MAHGYTKGIPISTDGTLSANSDLVVPSQKAVKTYVDANAGGGGGGGGTTTNSLTINNSGTGDASGATFNGSAAVTISYNTVGAQASNTNLTNLAALTYASTSFVKMTGANTFSLDTNTYLTSIGTGVTNELTYWTGANAIGSLTTATYPSLTELAYLKGVTSSVQTQLNNKKDTVTYGNVYAVTVGASSTVYAAVSGLTTFNATESNRHFAVPVAGTLKNLYVKMSGTQSATGTLVITMRNNATSSSVTVTVANGDGASPTKSDNTNTLAIAAGDLLAIQLVNNATVASASVVSMSFVIERS